MMDTASVVTLTESTETARTKKRWPLYIGVGVLCTIVGVFVVLGLLAFLRHTEDESTQVQTQSYVTTDVTYHLPNTEQILEETLVVTDTEEEITTKDAQIIFDYENGFVVTHMYKSHATSIDSICFVRKFNPIKGIGRIREILRKGKKDEYVKKDIREELFVPSGENFDKTLLSERASAMCKNSRVFRMEKAAGTNKDVAGGGSAVGGRAKRQLLGQCGGVQNVLCNFFCEPAMITGAVLKCTSSGSFLTWFSSNNCYYTSEQYEETICSYQCNCMDDGLGGEGSGEADDGVKAGESDGTSDIPDIPEVAGAGGVGGAGDKGVDGNVGGDGDQNGDGQIAGGGLAFNLTDLVLPPIAG